MGRKPKPTVAADKPRYSVAAVLRSGQYEPWIIKACLEEGKTYTVEEIKEAITKFTKGAK